MADIGFVVDHDHDIAVVHGVYNININQLITHGPGSACRQWNLAKMMDGHESIDIHGGKYFLQRIPTLAWMTYIKLIQVTSTSRYHKNQQKIPWTPLMFLGSINMFLYFPMAPEPFFTRGLWEDRARPQEGYQPAGCLAIPKHCW